MTQFNLHYLIFFFATSPAFDIFHTGTNDQRWSMVASVTLGYSLYALLKRKQLDFSTATLNKICLFITIYLCIYAYSHYVIKSMSLIGSFENPNVLSIHLCLLLPFAHNYTVSSSGLKKYFIFIIETVSIITIVLTMCRTGWICLIVFATCCIARGKWKILSISFFIPISILLGTNFKKDSTQGRSFILHNTIEIIKEAPFLGHGTNGFATEYMPRQAEYFKTHKDKQFEMLASDIHHPLNEFLLSGVNYGIVGILVLFAILTLPIVWKKKLYTNNRPLWTSLCIISIFCFFSYPLLYPLPWLVILLGWIEILKPEIRMFINQHRKLCTISTSLLLVITLGYTSLLLLWGYASREAKENKRSVEMMPIYNKLYPYLSWRGVFLYDFAIESFYAHRGKQAYYIADKCRKRYASYNLSLLQGDICRYIGRYEEGLKRYREASYMCPVRFAPLSGMLQIYQQIGDTVKADSMAQVILNKPIKIPSSDINEMKAEAKKWLERG